MNKLLSRQIGMLTQISHFEREYFVIMDYLVRGVDVWIWTTCKCLFFFGKYKHPVREKLFTANRRFDLRRYNLLPPIRSAADETSPSWIWHEIAWSTHANLRWFQNSMIAGYPNNGKKPMKLVLILEFMFSLNRY